MWNAVKSNRQSVSHEWSSLSQAESEVAVLAAAGWPNSAIAVRRGSSIRTVDAQISAVLHKLSIDSRKGIFRHLPWEFASTVEFESLARSRRLGSSRCRGVDDDILANLRQNLM
ncbi:helix-turn-helix domain-containing protein [Nocardia sp. NPDC004260]